MNPEEKQEATDSTQTVADRMRWKMQGESEEVDEEDYNLTEGGLQVAMQALYSNSTRTHEQTGMAIGTISGDPTRHKISHVLISACARIFRSRMTQLSWWLRNTFVDSMKMATLDLEDENIKTVIYKVIINVFKELIEEKCISEVITQSSSDAVCTSKNVDSSASKMATTVFDSPTVVFIMVERLQRQADQLVSQAVEHVGDRIAMEARSVTIWWKL